MISRFPHLKTKLLVLAVFVSLTARAQEVVIPISAAELFNRSVMDVTVPMMNTGNNNAWRYTGFWFWYKIIPPTIRSVSGNRFVQNTTGGASLPSTVLLWRLASIGGTKAPFRSGDLLPDYQSFSSSETTWYEPAGISGYTPGEINFRFTIGSAQFAANAFQAGDYTMDLAHNYTGSDVRFTPERIKVRLRVPAALSWLTAPSSQSLQISSLDQFRATQTFPLALGTSTVGATTTYHLWASASPEISYTSSQGTRSGRPISIITLGSTNNSTIASALSGTWKNVSPAGVGVEIGNRKDFNLQLVVSAADLRAYFFEAGMYSLRVTLQAKSVDNSLSTTQHAEISVKVPALSEIKIPSGQQVNFRFNTAAQYEQGETQRLPNHLILSNNENFELYVRSATPYLTSAGLSSTLPSSIFEIGLDGGTPVPLSTTPQKILSNAMPALDKSLDVTYRISPHSAQQLADKDKGRYSADVIYSFTAL